MSLIAAEDTRHTRRLLNHFEIRTRAVSYHAHSPDSRRQYILDQLLEGRSVALVSDAGTPTISDPGSELIIGAVTLGIPVVPVPGASAVLAALVSSALPTDRFVFQGFLPRRRQDRLVLLRALCREERTIVLYEAPHRLPSTLKDLLECLGDRPVSLCREITKLFEETWRGPLSAAIGKAGEGCRGEYVLVVGGAPDASREGLLEGRCGCVTGADDSEQEAERVTDAAVLAQLKEAVASGLSRRDAARKIARELSLPFRALYRKSATLAAPEQDS